MGNGIGASKTKRGQTPRFERGRKSTHASLQDAGCGRGRRRSRRNDGGRARRGGRADLRPQQRTEGERRTDHARRHHRPHRAGGLLVIGGGGGRLFQMRQRQWRHQWPPGRIHHRGRRLEARAVGAGGGQARQRQEGGRAHRQRQLRRLCRQRGALREGERARHCRRRHSARLLLLARTTPRPTPARASAISARSNTWWQKFGIKNIVCVSPNIPGVGEFSCDGVKAWGKDKGIDLQPDPDRSGGARRDLGPSPGDDLQAGSPRDQPAARRRRRLPQGGAKSRTSARR